MRSRFSGNTVRLVSALISTVAVTAYALAATPSGGPAGASALTGAVARLGCHGEDAARLAAGRATARALEPANDAELGAVGLVVLPVSIEQATGSFADLSLLERSGMVVEASRLSPSPTLDDLAGLEVPDVDARNLLKAKVADSDVKLSAPEIAAVRGVVPPSHIEAYKRALLHRVSAWRQNGLEGLGVYADKKRPVKQTDVSKSLVDRQSAERPVERLVKVDAFEYWSIVRLGDFKPLVELNHVSIYRGDGIARIETVQIYASHYCDALVTSIDLVEIPSTGGTSTLMRLTFRGQFDSLGGILGGLKRSIGRSRVVEQVAEGLERVRDTVGRDGLAMRRPAV